MGTSATQPAKINFVGQKKYVRYSPALCTAANEVGHNAPFRNITVRIELGVEKEMFNTNIATVDVVICTRKRGLHAMAEAISNLEKALRAEFGTNPPTLKFWRIKDEGEVEPGYVYIMPTRYEVLYSDIISMKVVDVGDELTPREALKQRTHIYWHAMEVRK